MVVSQLALYLFGTPRLELAGAPVNIPRRKALALFAYLVVTGHSHSRDALATLLWSEKDQSSARAELRRSLYVINRKLGNEWLTADLETIGLNPELKSLPGGGIWLDVQEFQEKLKAVEAHNHPASETCPDCLPLLEDAVALYTDHFMAGFSLPDSPGYDEWQFFQREGLRHQLANTLEQLSAHYSTVGEYEAAITYARRWLALDPLHEPAHRRLMTLFAKSGRKTAALRQYEICKSSLAAELDVQPAAETTKLYEQIRDQTSKPPPSLPIQITPFIGREEELDELAKLLAKPDVRLVTILAPGGMGKTRLALEAGAAQSAHFAHGVYFISLAPLGSVSGVLSTIAEAVNFQFYSGANPQQQLIDYFREKQVLLLLDNFEHLLAGTGLVNEILRAAPGVKVLVTSRARLNLRVETVYVLRGMAYQNVTSMDTLQESQRFQDQSAYSAIRLFVGSAQRVRPDFEIHSGNLNHITRICRLVGGMPLGIELAAAWAGMLSTEEIVNEIQGGLDFLAIEMLDAPKRHHSIRAVLERSWDMLDDSNQDVFKKLSVFRGGFTRNAAQEVAGAALQQLLTLANQSFIMRTRTGRYQVHELLRQFAGERLEQNADEKQRIHERHCEYFAAFVKQREAEILAGDKNEALLEIDNIRAAWRYAVKKGVYAAIRKLSFGFHWIYHNQGWHPEGLTAFESAADALREEDPVGERGIAYGQILWLLGMYKKKAGQYQIGTQLVCLSPVILRRLGADFELAIANNAVAYSRDNHDIDVLPGLQESLAIYQEMDISWGTAFTLKTLGDVYFGMGSYGEAEYNYQESLNISQKIKYNRGVAAAYRGLGDICFNQEVFSQARRQYEKSLTMYQRIGYISGIGDLFQSLGRVATILGEYDLAEEYHQEALSIHKDYLSTAFSTADLGDVYLATSRYGEARDRYQEALDIIQGGDFQPDRGMLFCKFGYLAAAIGDHQEAQNRFVSALKIGLDFQAVSLCLDTLPGMGTLLAQTGETEHAVEIAALALSHERSDPFTKEKARKLLNELEVQLSPEIYFAAQERGKLLDVEAAAQELAKDFNRKF